MIDTLIVNKICPLSMSVDSIMTQTSIEGGLDIGIRDSVNFILSGNPSVNIITPPQTDWTSIIGVATIVANVLIVGITFWYNKKLQKHETIEIRTRILQENEVNKKVEMYKLLAKLNEMAQNLFEYSKKDSQLRINTDVQNEFQQKVKEAQTYLTENALYIRDSYESIATNILNKFSVSNVKYDMETQTYILSELSHYSDLFNTPYVSFKSRILNKFKCNEKG